MTPQSKGPVSSTPIIGAPHSAARFSRDENPGSPGGFMNRHAESYPACDRNRGELRIVFSGPPPTPVTTRVCRTKGRFAVMTYSPASRCCLTDPVHKRTGRIPQPWIPSFLCSIVPSRPAEPAELRIQFAEAPSDQNLGVRIGPELMSARFQLLTELRVVIDFPVEDDVNRIVFV